MAGRQANVNLSINGVNRTNRAFAATRQNMRGMRRDVGRMNGAVLRNRRVIQQAGMQLSDFAVQVAGGQSAILAFTQNVPQFVQGFGAIGGVLAALITIFGTLALVAVNTGASLNKLTPIAGVLQDEFEWLVRIAGNLKEVFFDVANSIVNNLDRVLVYLATFLGVMAARWVVAFVVARGVVGTLTLALVALRAVLRSFILIGAFVVFAEAIFTFVKLIKVTGSFGAALDALRPLAGSVADVIGSSFAAAAWMMESGFYAASASIMEALASIDKFLIGMLRGSLKGLVAVVSFLTQRDMGHLTASIDAVQTSFTSAGDAADRFRGKSSDAANEAMDEWSNARNSAQRTREEFNRLREMTRSGGAGIDVRNWFGGSDDDAGKGIDGVTDKVKKLADAVRDVFSSGFDRMFDAIPQGSKAVIDSLRNIGMELLKLISKQFFFKSLIGSFPGLFGKGKVADLTGAILANANGNAFSNGRVMKFAKGGIVSRPTAFPMQSGAGLMGEAGPEAILPLSRNSGRLGVSAQLGQSPVNITIENHTGAQISYESERTPTGVNHRIIAREVDRSLREGRVDSAMKGRFAVSPQGSKR